ncbi:MAG TPA: NrfD/PsrC family molybdoenzyme membrane anchor subunit [Candidatus Sulfomarinibacteraceae bacterium]|nr:NrfD/PsrC family molybdoenzyme membrane anchor subunit [Candidatus Sulfomarinibacteraceae bacterium]
MHATGRSLTLAGHAVHFAPRAAIAAVAHEAIRMPRPLQLWMAFLLGMVALAMPAAFLALPPGWEVLGTTPTFEWGLLIVGYVFFAITTSGLCLASSLGTVFGIERFRPLEKRHAILALLCLITAFGIIALDLHYPVRMVLGAMLVPSPSSPMWWMGVFYGIYLCVLVVEVWSMFTHHPRIHQAACTMAACTAIVAPATLGAVFGVLVARPFWHGPFTPILMVASAFLSGTSLLGVVFFVVHRLRLEGAERAVSLAIPAIRALLTIGLVIVSLLVARQVVAGLAGERPALVEATQALVSGPLAVEFWAVRVGLGLVIPLVLVAVPVTRTPAGTFIAAGLALVGVFVDRMTFVSAGQIAPTSASGVVAAPYATYTPSLVEIGVIIGATAFVALGYTLAERYLDLSESHEVHAPLSLSSIRRRLRGARREADAR